MLASRKRLESVSPRRTNPRLKVRYYTPEVHKAAFVLPLYIQEYLQDGEDEEGVSTA